MSNNTHALLCLLAAFAVNAALFVGLYWLTNDLFMVIWFFGNIYGPIILAAIAGVLFYRGLGLDKQMG